MRAALAAPPRAGGSHAIFLLDLNGFKQVNDVYGHGVGDELLTVVAQRLASAVTGRGSGWARLGGDEFAILSRHLMGAEAATSTARRVLRSIGEPIQAGKNTHRLGVRGSGLRCCRGASDSTQEILRKADVALYRAKSERRSALRFFESGMGPACAGTGDRLDQDLRAAIEADAIRPFFSAGGGFGDGPREIVRGGGAVDGCGAGRDSAGTVYSGGGKNGLIHELFARTLRHACVAASQWPEDVTFSLDVFPSQLKDPSLHNPSYCRCWGEHGDFTVAAGTGDHGKRAGGRSG